MRKRNRSKLATIVVLITLLTGCATTQMASQVNREVRNLEISRVLVDGLFKDLQQAQLAESRLCAELSRKTTYQCVRALDVFFPGQEYSGQERTSRLLQLQIDAVLTLEPTASGKTSTYYPGKTYTTASATVYENTVTGSSTTRTYPGYDIESPWVNLRASLWSVADGKNAWYATATSSGDFVGWNDLIRSAAGKTVSNLVADGVFRSAKRSVGRRVSSNRDFSDVINGKVVTYYVSGKVAREGNLVNGKEEGKWIDYYESGKVKWEVDYVDGKEDGRWIWFYEDGRIFSESCFETGDEVDCP